MHSVKNIDIASKAPCRRNLLTTNSYCSIGKKVFTVFCFKWQKISFTAEAVKENASMLPIECGEKKFQRYQNAVKKKSHLKSQIDTVKKSMLLRKPLVA